MKRRRGRPPHPDVLTPAEWDVLDLVRHGMTKRQLAARRGTSFNAAKYHVANIRGKLGLKRSEPLRDWPGVPIDSARHGRELMTNELGVERLGQVSLLAREIARSEAFYRDVLGLTHRFTYGDLAFFDIGETRLFLQQVPEDAWRPGSILYLAVADIGAGADALAGRGVRLHGAPHRIHTHDDGTEEWMAFFADPDGNTLALMSKVTPA